MDPDPHAPSDSDPEVALLYLLRQCTETAISQDVDELLMPIVSKDHDRDPIELLKGLTAAESPISVFLHVLRFDLASSTR